jgi:hypothetical protein
MTDHPTTDGRKSVASVGFSRPGVRQPLHNPDYLNRALAQDIPARIA